MARTTLLSPSRYLRTGYGLALPTGYTQSQLRSALIRAQDHVTRFCNAPTLPQAFDWRGGAMVGEKHQWKIVNPLAYGPGARRVYTNCGPIRTVTAFSLDLGLSYHVDIDPTDNLYINPTESYVEIVAIAPTVVGAYPLNINLGLYNPIARISYTYGRSYEVASDVLEAESPTVFSAAYGNWDSAVAPVIEVAGVELDPADYSIDYDDGLVTLDTAPTVGQQVEASYTYTVPSEVVDAIGYAATGELNTTRMNARGMAGLQSLRVAEVAMTRMQPSASVSRNGVSLPVEAASLLGAYTFGSVQG